MKKLFLIRHAKAENLNDNSSDVERKLLNEGIKRTLQIVKYMQENDLHIDFIISSHAVRAHETAKIIAKNILFPINNIEIDSLIYGSHHSYLVEKVHGLSDAFENILIVGHNPVITYLANYFLSDEIDFLPTSGLIVLEFSEGLWQNVHYTEDFKLIFPQKQN